MSYPTARRVYAVPRSRGHRQEVERVRDRRSSGAAQARGLTWQKLILGDWSRFVRDPLDVARIVFIAGTIVWGLSGRPVTVLVAASIVLIARPHREPPSLLRLQPDRRHGPASRGARCSGVYDSWKFYDNVVHFTVPLLVTGMIYLLLVRLGVLPELSDLTQVHQKFGFFLTAVVLGMAIGAGWEIIEWSLDEWAGANLVGSATDTATDLIWDTMGATGSALILTLWSLGGHSLKRRPGAALANKPFGSFLTIRAHRNRSRELSERSDHDG